MFKIEISYVPGVPVRHIVHIAMLCVLQGHARVSNYCLNIQMDKLGVLKINMSLQGVMCRHPRAYTLLLKKTVSSLDFLEGDLKELAFGSVECADR